MKAKITNLIFLLTKLGNRNNHNSLPSFKFEWEKGPSNSFLFSVKPWGISKDLIRLISF